MPAKCLRAEREMLRKELLELKHCQIRYFTLSVSSTALIIGIVLRLFGNDPSGLFFLAPLIIVLPCWWVFFDKATTITRIVAYTRILEANLAWLSVGKTPVYNHFGWENSLWIWRDLSRKHPLPPALISLVQGFLYAFTKIPKLLLSNSFHRYWIVNWATFMMLSVVCIVLSFKYSDSSYLGPSVALLATICVAGATADILLELVTGRYSYERNAKKWHDILH